MKFSIIIPVYNRPSELDELLKSIVKQQRKFDFEVIIIEDGSTIKSDTIVKEFKTFLTIKYFYKENSGPGDSRNFGMQKAINDYFIILDSDCILPQNYLNEVGKVLKQNYSDAYGGADTAHSSFTNQQKAINYSMTSILTTGGIRGSEIIRNKFQLRSFNMGISKKAFLKTGGFSKQHLGEDIDLTFRLWNCGFETQFIPKAFVYHKRRSTWQQFLKQTFNFGAARPILNKTHPNSAKITFWFPSVFVIGLLLLIASPKIIAPIYGIYFLLIFIDSLLKNKNIEVAVLSIYATLIQFLGYGTGFLRSIFQIKVLKKSVKEAFPKMFSL
ncbi:MAG: glycosyltransferase [Flavobacteriaceae bacterium]|nr:glycosyltransferase [Flavobacteriaceae bacterium]